MKKDIQIILVQKTTVPKAGETLHTFRIAKLMGAVTVFSGSAEYHVGDYVDKNVAESFTRCPHYKVTVTEQGGKE
jgi:hypothetical protein